jgi:DNA-binding MarR family transcriptional regulator
VTGEGGSEQRLPESIQSLTPTERQVLAVLAVVGEASLTADELAVLAEVDDVGPALDELDRRGLVRREDDRDALAAGLGAKLRRAWDLTDTADRVLRQFISIAQDGKLTLADLPAILGISRWAAEAERWSELLRLITVTETVLDVKQRVETWIQIVEQARVAARKLGDQEAEAWAEDQLAASSRAIANATGAAAGAATSITPPNGASRTATWLKAGAAALVIAGAGFGIGYAASGDSSSATQPTVTVPGTTVTLPATTVSLSGATTTLPGTTVTLPGDTVTLPAETSTVVSTATETTTATVVSTVVTTVTVVG